MMKNLVVATFASAAFATSASAVIHVFTFPLTVGEEVPAPVGGAAGTGTATVTLDDVLNTVSVTGSYSGMTSAVNASHIHGPGAIGVIAPAIVTLANTGLTAGTISVTNAPMTPANVAAMIAGNTYINVHTVTNSPGELRGQVVQGPPVVPTISEWGMIVLGLVVLTGGTLVIHRRMAQPVAASTIA